MNVGWDERSHYLSFMKETLEHRAISNVGHGKGRRLDHVSGHFLSKLRLNNLQTQYMKCLTPSQIRGHGCLARRPEPIPQGSHSIENTSRLFH